jgi:hypothetical protein
MATRPTPDSLTKIVRDLERRIRALETGGRIGYASIPDGGALTVLDSTGTSVLRIGTLTSGGYGIEKWNGTAWTVVA